VIGITINLHETNPIAIPLMKKPLSYVIPALMIVWTTGSVAHAEDAVNSTSTSQSATPAPAAMSDKEAAFRQFYKRDPACDSFRDDNMMDRCRHAYMTAKKEFDKVWANRKQN
jgi:hypothetical protein